MNKINISVIIPTYNNVHYIKDAIESVYSQTYDSFEIIVIDDGSIDNTRFILEPYLNKIQYLYQEHTGVSAARNKGLSVSTGKYIVFLDSDDFFLPDKFIEQATFLDNHPEIGMMHSGWKIIDEKKNLLAIKEPWNEAPKLDLENWLIWQPIFLGAMMFRRSWLEKAGEFDTTLNQAEDTDFLLQLSKVGCTAAWLKQPTVYYRQHQKGITKNSLERVECVNKVIGNFFSQKDLPESIQLLEKKVRYQILMWSVWQLYRSGNVNQVTNYLQKTLMYLSNSPKHIIHGWLMALLQQCRADNDHTIEELQNFWPYFKEVIHGDEEVLKNSERLFYWLLKSETRLKPLNKTTPISKMAIAGERK